MDLYNEKEMSSSLMSQNKLKLWVGVSLRSVHVKVSMLIPDIRYLQPRKRGSVSSEPRQSGSLEASL